MADKQHYLLSSLGPIRLEMDKHLFFGRADGNNIVVDDTRASRRHAELYYDGSDFILIDLNSSNGTQVNGDRISSVTLKDGDEISIGMQSYRYRCVENSRDLETSFQKMQKDTRGMVTAEMPAINQSLPDTDFNGVLGSMSIPEIVQTLELGLRSGLLMIVSAQKEKGLLHFRDGAIHSAEIGHAKGDEAALKILGITRGTFSFRSKAPALEGNVTQSTRHLLMEAMRLGDESSR